MSYMWRPSAEYLDNANVTRLMRELDVDTIDSLRVRSVDDIGAFWGAVVDDLGIAFHRPFSAVVDRSRGAAWAEWFVDGGLNATAACLGAWTERTPDAIAVVHETEDGVVTRLTYRELADRVARLRAGLRKIGVRKGDPVGLFCPMTVEAVVAVYATASLGAILVPLFSGFAAPAIANRLRDAGAKVVITADGTMRRRERVAMLAKMREAVRTCPTVETVVVVANLGEPVEVEPGEIAWETLLGSHPDPQHEPTDASDVLLLAYTSGTTGQPKGAVHTHAGFVVKATSEVAYSFDMSAGRTFCWVTDMGWVMGPISIFGTHGTGGTLLLFEGSLDVPDGERLWQLAQQHSVAVLGVSPTLIRTLRGADGAPQQDLICVKVIGSTGEPWDPESYEWLARDVFKGRVPIINFSGGTEVGGSFLSPYPVEEIRTCSLGGPALGMDVDVVDDAAGSVRGEVGELVCRQPWPSMTRGIWNDSDGMRYHQAYWATFDEMWCHGDFALVDDRGDWFILGRSDDVMNVAGKRVAPAEIESIVATDTDVIESAAVGIPDETKGETVWVFYVARPEASKEADVAARVRDLVATGIGKPFAPSQVIRVGSLPKTRSAKTMRRAIRAAVLGVDPGDLSGAENPHAVDEIRDLVRDLR